MDMDNKRIVEMVGLPGSGKTYLLSHLTDNGVKVIMADEFYNESRKMGRIKKDIRTIKTLICDIGLIFNIFTYALSSCRPLSYSLKRFESSPKSCVK